MIYHVQLLFHFRNDVEKCTETTSQEQLATLSLRICSVIWHRWSRCPSLHPAWQNWINRIGLLIILFVVYLNGSSLLSGVRREDVDCTFWSKYEYTPSPSDVILRTVSKFSLGVPRISRQTSFVISFISYRNTFSFGKPGPNGGWATILGNHRSSCFCPPQWPAGFEEIPHQASTWVERQKHIHASYLFVWSFGQSLWKLRWTPTLKRTGHCGDMPASCVVAWDNGVWNGSQTCLFWGQDPFDMHAAAQQLENVSYGISDHSTLDVSWRGCIVWQLHFHFPIFSTSVQLTFCPKGYAASRPCSWKTCHASDAGAVLGGCGALSFNHLFLSLVHVLWNPRYQTDSNLWGKNHPLKKRGATEKLETKDVCTKQLWSCSSRGYH